MKLTYKHFALLFAACMVPAGAFAEIVHISTPKTSLVIDAKKGKDAKFLYYGNKLSGSEVDELKSAGTPNLSVYPSYGMSTVSESALSAVHADGNMTLDLVVDKVSKHKDGDSDVTTVALKDKYYPFFVNVNYRTYPDEDVIETWTEINHQEKGKVNLTQFASGYLPVRYGDVWLSQLYGSWANEGRVDEAPLNHGMKVIKNKDGARNSHTSHGEVMLSLDGKARENEGRVIGAALCYSGNYKLRFDTDDSNYHHFFAGINEENSEYHLPKNEVFATPPLALTYSEEGLSGASRNFHKWGRNHKLAHGNTPRKILLNSWEGVYFDINEEGMAQMMEDIASMGGELFVMDDGWFGAKYPRTRDNSSLGDWTVDTGKLPNGINGLLDMADRNGIRFGI